MADPIIASSEFDPSGFIKGIDDMTAALGRLNAMEEQIRGELANINTALQANRKELKTTQEQIAALDKSSASYQENLAQLTAQEKLLLDQQKALGVTLKSQKEELINVNKSADEYKGALTNLLTVSKQVQSQTKGKTLFDVISMQQQIKDITNIGAKYRDLFKGKIDTAELDELEDKLMSTADQFEQLRTVIAFIEKQLATLDPNSEAFQELNQVVEVGKQILNDFGDVENNVEKRGKSLTSQLKGIRGEMQQMILAGEEGTEKFKELEKEAAHLQEAINKAGERVKTFTNDTRLIGAGLEALRGLAAGYEVVTGVTALFGVQNEAAEETIKRLTAIMAVMNGLQEITNLLKKESVVRLVTEEIATKALTISQRVLAVTLGTTAAASRALSVALAATGIGAIVIAVGLLVTALSKWADEAKEAAKQQELLNAAVEVGIRLNDSFIDAVGDAGKQLAAEAELRQALNDKIGLSEDQKLRQRVKNAQELRDIEIATLTEQLGEARSFEREERANYDKAADRRREALEGRIHISDEELKALGTTIENFSKIQETGNALENQLEIRKLNNLRDQARERQEIRQAELNRTEDFLKRLLELQKRLLDAQNAQQRQDATQIAKQAADNLKFQLAGIDREVRKGILTRGQGSILKDLLKQISGVELTTELDEFRRKSIEAQNRLQDEIFAIKMAAGEQRVKLIRNELRQEAAMIQVEFDREFAALNQQQTELLKGVDEALREGLISPEIAKTNAEQIRLVYAQMFELLLEENTRKQEALAAKAFEVAQENLRVIFANVQLFVSETAAQEIVTLTRQYTSGKISYEKYQKELTRINQVESRRRIDTAIREAEALLIAVQARIKAEQDPGRRKKLQDEERELRNRLADLRKQLAQGDAAATKQEDEAFDAKLARIASYAQAINSVVQAVVGFWAQANQAEQEQLDRSIRIQEKRVEAATRIAERGNAEYLRLEEDRLNELRVKQENAARRQLAINAILQASQALTAFISALAQGIATGGPLGGLAIAAAVLGAIASGYAIVQSLQADTPQTFNEGTTSVKRKGAPAGEDTIPAMLSEDEAVIPAGVNKDYRKTVEAIYRRKVPPGAMNDFVNNYRSNRAMSPKLDYERIGGAADVIVTFDGRLMEATEAQNRKLDEQNELLHSMNKKLSQPLVNMTLDKNGLAIAVMQAIENFKIGKRS